MTDLKHQKASEGYHQQCLQKILCVNWKDKRTNTSILSQENPINIEAMFIQH